MRRLTNTPDAENDDATLLWCIADGDANAFDQLFLRHHLAVFGFIRRMVDGDNALAEDLTQECFLRVWRNRQTLRPGAATVRTLLLTIARNLTFDQQKRKVPVTEPLWSDETPLSPDLAFRLIPGPERHLLAKEAAQTLNTAIDALSPDLREVFLLRETEHLPYETIAEMVNCPLGTVKSRLAAARVHLRRALTNYMKETIL